jgi:hypothetical protein
MPPMRRVVIIALLPLLLAGCENPLRKKLESIDGPVVRPGTHDPATGRYIPPVCVANGSYSQAVECFRIAELVRFRTANGQGTLTRKGGVVRMVFYIATNQIKGSWTATAEKDVVVWAFNGVRVDVVPDDIARIFELVARYPGPTRKEGEPILTGRDEKAITYEFTDEGSGENYVVKVDPASGHLRRLTVGEIDLTFG